MDERIDEIVQEIQDETMMGSISNKVFRSTLNQPNLVAVSSADGVQEAPNATPLSQSSYYAFTCNLPRPCLDVASIQLVSSNIPQAQSNIPDTACVFWYYRCSQYNSKRPNINNLFYNRLLPATYKQEFVYAPTQYGWNRTFKNYKDLATELAKIGTKDLCWYNWTNDTSPFADGNYVPYIPGDATFALNTEINKFQMTGNNVYTIPTYISFSPYTTYALDARVYYGGLSWKSLQATNLNHLPDEVGSVWWVEDYNEVIAEWNDSTNYGVGRYVTNGTNIYISTYPNATQNPNLNYTWSATQTYSQFQVVLEPLDGLLYTYVNPTPKVGAPSRPFAGGGNWSLTVWSSSGVYVQGFICSYGGIFYEALELSGTGLPAGPRQPDTNPDYWTPIAFWTQVDTTLPTIWNRYLITGFQDPNVLQAQGTEFEYEWDATYLYEAGTVINYNGSSYEAVTQNIGTPPLDAWDATKIYNFGDQVLYTGGASPKYYQSISIPPNQNHLPSTSTTWWVPIRTEWKNTTSSPVSAGLFYLTSQFDLLGTDGTHQIVFPTGIAGQPFVAVPKRLLNSVLGFTWNGVFNSSQITDDFPTLATTVITQFQALQNVSLLNRFRPVPFYEVAPAWSPFITYPRGFIVLFEGITYKSLRPNNKNQVPSSSPTYWVDTLTGLGVGLIPGNTASLTRIFTADAYACLVYSSIISVYTSIVGASSLDTSRNTNLLAITPMNAGNLGIAFSNPFIENPLNKIAGDIYSIYIEMRDEFGEPYLLSNNAVSTFTLKVKYLEENLPRKNT